MRWRPRVTDIKGLSMIGPRLAPNIRKICGGRDLHDPFGKLLNAVGSQFELET